MQFRPLHESFGAEVLDFDVRSLARPEQMEALERAFDAHHLLLFRAGGPIPPDRQVEMTGWFGPVTDDSGEGRGWSTLTNAEASGQIRLPFHSDFTYTYSPIQGISLQAMEIPPGGATTAFASGVRGWATLPFDRRESLGNMRVRHSHRSSITPELPDFVAHHPLCLEHPRTGVPVLFVTEFHSDLIEGLESDESHQVLEELFAHLYRPENVYLHHWKLYDLLIWDNLALQHSRQRETAMSDGARSFQRVSLNDRTYSELIDQARNIETRSI
ncbi:TauD/TfdA family dioxygenase [Myxococcota bacterium]|nr:TauD/TfdA family dioxygenase [Myxococcota bacterium]